MIISEVANGAGRTDIAAFAAALLALQMLVGLPIASICLAKAANQYVKDGMHKSKLVQGKTIDFKIIKSMPGIMTSQNGHFTRIAIAAVIGMILATITGVTPSVTCLIIGLIFGAIGLVDKGALGKAGADGMCMVITWAYVLEPFLTMTMGEFGELLPIIFGMLILSAAGIAVVSALVAKFLKWNPWLGIALGLCCMMGYPLTQMVATEVSNGITSSGDFTEEEKANVLGYMLPKMLISGTVSVSFASAILAGIIAPILFS